MTAADRIADVGNVEGDRAKPMPAHWCAAPRRTDAAFTLVTRAGPWQVSRIWHSLRRACCDTDGAVRYRRLADGCHGGAWCRPFLPSPAITELARSRIGSTPRCGPAIRARDHIQAHRRHPAANRPNVGQVRLLAGQLHRCQRCGGEAGFALGASRTAWPGNASRWRHGWPVRCRPTPAHCRPVCRSTTFAACSPTRPAVPAPSPGHAAAGPGRRSHCNDLSLTSFLPKVALGISQRSRDVQVSNQHQLPPASKRGG